MTLAVVLLLAALGAAPMAQGGQAPPPPPPPPTDVVIEPLPPPAPPDTHAVLDAPYSTQALRAAPAPAVLDAYRADPAFQYDHPEAEGPSLWDRFWTWLWRSIWQPIQESTSAGFRDWVIIGLAVGALGWVVARLLRTGGVGVFARGARAGVGVGPLMDVEDIAEVDLETRLGHALAAGDHREAVRVRYLRLLQALDAAGVVAWRRDKTNRQYVAEVAAADPRHAPSFRRATRAFDAVWYGERPVSESLYARLAPVFDGAHPAAP